MHARKPTRCNMAWRAPRMRSWHTTASSNVFLFKKILPLGVPWICTKNAHCEFWPDAPGHSNQILRYWRNLTLDNELAMPPHRAAPDAWVTAHLLSQMLDLATTEQMISWTTEPKLLPKVPFGKHRNMRWSEVPSDYLSWMVKQADMDKDVVWCAQVELKRR